jgi:hypothetical protein
LEIIKELYYDAGPNKSQDVGLLCDRCMFEETHGGGEGELSTGNHGTLTGFLHG